MMKTVARTNEKYEQIFLQMTREYQLPAGAPRPRHFIEVMRRNKGGMIPWDKAANMPYRNPLVVALGDSVTAGHFEWTENGKKTMEAAAYMGTQPAGAVMPAFDPTTIDADQPAVEITDVRACYVERFRAKLIDLFEETSLTILNSGIAGDTLLGMRDRLKRDVLCHMPDLVTINGSLNWNVQDGDADVYGKILTDVVRRIRQDTDADIILMTPNATSPGLFNGGKPDESLPLRAEAIRKVAIEERTSLCDTYAIWQQYIQAGYPVEELLANGINHPTVTGHEAYAMMLMKLFE